MIGTGIFTTTGFLAGDLGRPDIVLWSWVAGAFFAVLGALCYSELGVNLPNSGGEYVYLTRAYGPTWGFMSGWVSYFAGFSAPVAVAALAFADYLGHVCHACADEKPRVLLSAGEWTLRFGKAEMIACGLVGVLTILNLLGVKRAAGIQNLLTAAKILILAAFILLAFGIGQGSWQHFEMITARTSSSPMPAQFAISLFYIYLSYSGWNAATYVAEEIRQPARTLPLALAFGTGLVAALYVVLNVVYIYAAPLDALKGQVAVGALAATHLFGPGVARTFSALMALSLMASVNAQVLTGPRVYFAMAENGAFFASAKKIHPRWRTPWVAILAQGVCTVLMTLTPLPQLLQYIGFTLSIFTALGVASLFRFRRQPGWHKLKAVSFGWPLIPILFLIPEVWIIFWGVQLKPSISLAGAVTIATGALFYHVWTRPRRSQVQVVGPNTT
jgi:basic amino acid/polyamine antiporter, APA family